LLISTITKKTARPIFTQSVKRCMAHGRQKTVRLWR